MEDWGVRDLEKERNLLPNKLQLVGMENELRWYRRLGLSLSSSTPELCNLTQSLYLPGSHFFTLYETGDM